MFCTKCGKEKGTEAFCPYCGAKGGKIVLSVKDPERFPIFAIIFAFLAFFVLVMDTISASTLMFWSGAIQTTMEIVEFYSNYIFLFPFLVIAMDLFSKSRSWVFSGIVCFYIDFCRTLLMQISMNPEWALLFFFILLCWTFLLIWCGIFTFSASKKRGFVTAAPYIAAGVQLISAPLCAWFNLRIHESLDVLGFGGIIPEFFGSTAWMILTVVIWGGFAFFITKFFADFYSVETAIVAPSVPAPKIELDPEEETFQEEQTEKTEQNGFAFVPNEEKRERSEKEIVETLLEYKALLDSGIITQEEFDRKKAQLLK
ncbi:MAG: hypothetical protein E7580_04470 [Ruminococcaceae bacterium]|nr:hypothetical protein [Oscillospiraceae bacterium]